WVKFAAWRHVRVLEAYLAGSADEELERLYGRTVGLCAQHEPVDRMRREVAAALATPDARFVREFSDRARLLYLELPGELERARSFCALVEEHDRRYLAEVKLAVREAVRVFEELEAATIDEGA